VPGRHRSIWVILAAALFIRLAWGMSRPVDDATINLLPDQSGYLELGRNLLRGAGLNYFDERFGQTVHAARMPGYPAFVALCGGSVRAIRFVQSLLDTSTALAAYLLARRLLQNDFASLVAAALVAFNPFLVYFSALILTETLYTAMLLWAMVLFTRGRWLGGIALLILGVYVRPPGLLLPILLGGASAFLPLPPGEGRGEGGRRASLCALFAAGAIALALFPWALRNHARFGRWIWSTTNDGITAYDGFNPRATGESRQQPFIDSMPQLREMGEVERSDYLAHEAKRFATENPGRVAQLTLAKVARTWTPVPLSSEFGKPAYRAVALLFAIPFDLLVIAGIVSQRIPRVTLIFLLLPTLYFTAIHALSVGSLRYRMPAEPILAVVAAAGATRVLARKNEERIAPS
jgi:4-amino-4-deoxy-L-arabinose transferase-like glycosyltransferase